ncbi:MAG: hypothetical protein RBQ72_06330 [Desulfobacterium sp.]|jgi:hypothetical protein|nr:hypothetical protein [Desulfobacterium sp.]
MTDTRQQDPDKDGLKIPDSVKSRIKQRIIKHAETKLAGRYTTLDVRFHDKFCYVDAYAEPNVIEDWPAGFPETREEHIDRMRKTPIHLCRLLYFGDEKKWGLAFYSYADNKYETSVFSDGKTLGTPELAVETCAGF